jgi:hypothetical protein
MERINYQTQPSLLSCARLTLFNTQLLWCTVHFATMIFFTFYLGYLQFTFPPFLFSHIRLTLSKYFLTFPICVLLVQFIIFLYANSSFIFGKFLDPHEDYMRARGSVIGCGTMLEAGRSRVRFPMRSLDFSIDLILPGVLGPWDRLSL